MPRPCKLTFDLLTLKVVSESHVKWATTVPIVVFLGLSVLHLGPTYATYRQTSDAHHRLMPHTLGAGHNKLEVFGDSKPPPQRQLRPQYSYNNCLSLVKIVLEIYGSGL